MQFTKEHGIARRAGLKPGDQILSCNGVEFQDIFFNDAVTVMKASSHLELVIRTAVGLELFPGESSGYNSSASSVTGGERESPCWNESRRYDVEGRMHASKVKSPFKPKSSSGHRDRLMVVNTPKVPQLISFQNAQPQSQMRAGGGRGNEIGTRPSQADPNQNTTIIKLSEQGTIINNTLIPNVCSPPAGHQKASGMSNRNKTLVRVQSLGNGIDCFGQEPERGEQRTVVVEVHRGDSSIQRTGKIPPPPPPIKATTGGGAGAIQSAPVVPSSIADEIKRRAEVSERERRKQNGK